MGIEVFSADDRKIIEAHLEGRSLTDDLLLRFLDSAEKQAAEAFRKSDAAWVVMDREADIAHAAYDKALAEYPKQLADFRTADAAYAIAAEDYNAARRRGETPEPPIVPIPPTRPVPPPPRHDRPVAPTQAQAAAALIGHMRAALQTD